MKKTFKVVNVRMSVTLYELLNKKAGELDVTVSRLMRSVLENAVAGDIKEIYDNTYLEKSEDASRVCNKLIHEIEKLTETVVRQYGSD